MNYGVDRYKRQKISIAEESAKKNAKVFAVSGECPLAHRSKKRRAEDDQPRFPGEPQREHSLFHRKRTVT